MVRFFSILMLIPATFGQSTSSSPGSCCLQKTVSNLNPDLNGVYMFKREGEGSLVEDCFDGCIYSKEGPNIENEYCFRAVTTGAATIEDQCSAQPSSGPSSSPPIVTTVIARRRSNVRFLNF